MQSPSILSATLDTIKEGAMAIIQQTLPKLPATAVRDEAFTHTNATDIDSNVAPQ